MTKVGQLLKSLTDSERCDAVGKRFMMTKDEIKVQREWRHKNKTMRECCDISSFLSILPESESVRRSPHEINVFCG